jgi:hypothetical protein
MAGAGPVPIELDAVKAQLEAVADYAIQNWDTATLGSCITIMNNISSSQVEINAEAAAIAALPQPPAAASTTVTTTTGS